MKIAIIGPGLMPIPPSGWGAVEILIHEYCTELRKNGWDVLIVNTPDKAKIAAEVNAFAPDFVHCQYDEHIDVMAAIACPAKAITSHFGYLDQVWKFPAYLYKTHKAIVLNKDVLIFALSSSIAEAYRQDGVAEDRLFVMPNGVRLDRFRFTEQPRHGDRSLYLAKVDYRKRQGIFQGYDCGIDFAGNLCPHSAIKTGFDPQKPDYLGEWSKETVYDRMTDYANLVLLSDGEAHPLVCLEAMAAGLGLVLSQYATANLDLTKPFIDVIPEDKITDRDYVRRVIAENRAKSLKHRAAIRAYAAEFTWERVVARYMETVTAICLQKKQAAPVVPQKPKLAVVTVATGKYYDLFFRDLEQSIVTKLAPGCDIKIYCFTDHQGPAGPATELCPARHYGWPFDTLLRFHLMSGILDRLMTHDFILYMDSDMTVQGALAPDILGANLVAVAHPGFFHNPRAATYEIDRAESAFVPLHQRKNYVQGCLWGAKPFYLKNLILTLTGKIDRDLAEGRIPVWHDESYLNWFFAGRKFRLLSPAYAYPEGWDLPFAPLILHRAKNHDKVRGTELEGLSADKIIEGLSPETQAEYSRILYLRAHEKNQRLEQRIIRAGRNSRHVAAALHVFPVLLRKGVSLSGRIYRRAKRAFS